MGFDIILNLFVEHPVAAIICLFVGGGILFGLIGGLTGILFFKTWWFILIIIGLVIFFIWTILEVSRSY